MYEVIIGLAIMVVAEVAKRFNIDQKYVMTFLAIFFAIVYYFYQTYFDQATQKSIVEMITQISGSATIIYNSIKIAFQQTQK